MAKTRIRRGSRVYAYERENYRDRTGKVKHRNTRYLGIEVTIKGEKPLRPNGKLVKSVLLPSAQWICEVPKAFG